MPQKLVAAKMISSKNRERKKIRKRFDFNAPISGGSQIILFFFLTVSEKGMRQTKSFFLLMLVFCHVNRMCIQNSIPSKTFSAHVLLLQTARKQHQRSLFTILSLIFSPSKECKF